MRFLAGGIMGILLMLFLNHTSVVPVVRDISFTEMSERTIVLEENNGFRFYTRVDREQIEWVIDTGSDVVLLSKRTAAILGVRTEGYRTQKTNTVGGIVDVVPVEIRKMQFGGIVVHRVGAAIVTNDFSQNLLGMTFLRKLKRFEFSKGQLTLEK